MNLVEKTLFLKENPLFEDLDVELILPIANKAEVIYVKQNQPLFHPKEVASRLYFVVKGTVETQNEIKQVLRSVQSGEFFGVQDLFTDALRSTFAIAKEKGVLLSLSKSYLFTILSEIPSVAICLLKLQSKGI
jgi:CRP-like cAMP-binding protein